MALCKEHLQTIVRGGGTNPRHLTLKCRAASAGATQTRQRTPETLRNPAHLTARTTRSIKVPDAGGPISLNDYMLLPVEQYVELDRNLIKPISKNRFLLSVPRIQLFNVWIEPQVEVTVEHVSNPDRVVLKATSCTIRGSDVVEAMQLNDRFCLKFETELQWTPGTPSTSNNGNALLKAEGEIKGDAQLDVWSEVVPPFNLMPREMLEAGSNTVVVTLVNSLLPLFLTKLADDYKHWASDEAYRRGRAARY